MLCQQFMGNLESVRIEEEERGASATAPTPRWTLATQLVMRLNEIVPGSNDSVWTEDAEEVARKIDLCLNKDLQWAAAKLGEKGAARRGAASGGAFSAADDEYAALQRAGADLRQAVAQQQAEAAALAARVRQMEISGHSGGSDAGVYLTQTGNRRQYPHHKGMTQRGLICGGSASEFEWLKSTGKIPQFADIELGPVLDPGARVGKVGHEDCPFCKLALVPITRTWGWEEFKKEFGHDPVRIATNECRRALEAHETTPHYKLSCYHAHGPIDEWAARPGSTEDPDYQRVTGVLSMQSESFRAAVTAHKKAFNDRRRTT